MSYASAFIVDYFQSPRTIPILVEKLGNKRNKEEPPHSA